MEQDAPRIAEIAGRPAPELTRRDLARALLARPAADALTVLPGWRRQLVAAGNPLSAPFWESAAAVIQKVADGAATVGDVQDWLESTGTEPAWMIGMHAWDDEDERSPVQAEVHGLLVARLEGLVARGLIDPDRLVAGAPGALREHRRLQEEWMMSPLPDGRVPMWVVTDETDGELLAEWAAAEAEALAQLRAVLAGLPARPLPEAALHAVCDRIRAGMKQPGWPRELLAACGGVDPRRLPRDDEELWLTLAAGIVSPRSELRDDSEDAAGPDEPSEDEEAMVALCALDHVDWLAAMAALARGGAGTPAADHDLARYVSEFDPDDVDDQADAAAAMFRHAVALWQVLGAIDDAGRLTPLGWWGLAEAGQRAWAPGR